MELRSRSTRPSSVAFPGANGDRKTGERNMDVSLGPTIYAGERYGKMSERRRRRKNAPDLDQAARHILAPRLIGFGIAFTLVLIWIFYMQYQASQRRQRYRDTLAGGK